MMIGTAADFNKNKNIYSGAIRKGLEFLSSSNLHELIPGKYELEDNMYMLIQEYETKPQEEVKYELHDNFLDIQYMVSGEEKIGYSPFVIKESLCEDQLSEKDIAFYDEVKNEMELMLGDGMFAIFLPNEAHRPCCTLGEKRWVRKAVIKIHKEIL